MKKVFKLITATTLVVLNILCLTILSPIISIQTATPLTFGKLVLTILEKGTTLPVDNATVCIVETRQYFSTNNKGVTPTIEIPILKNNLSNNLEQYWGEITIIAYKPGYRDHVTFYKQVPINKTMIGSTIFLSPIYSESDLFPTVSTDSPIMDWTIELIKNYKQ